MTLATASVLLMGCAHGNTGVARAHEQDDGLLDAGMTQQRTVVHVTNNNWSDMTIYLVRDGSQQRLGSVPSHHDLVRDVVPAQRPHREQLVIGIVFDEQDGGHDFPCVLRPRVNEKAAP